MVTLLLLTPATSVAATAAPDDPSPGTLPPETWGLVAAWLREGEPALAVPTTAREALEALAPGATVPPSDEAAWDAYLGAVGVSPTPAEHHAIRRLLAVHPHLAAQIESLASDVAAATRLREEAFARLSPEERARLPALAARLATLDEAPLDEEDARILALVELEPLARGAKLLAEAAARAQRAVPEAVARDLSLARAVDARLRDPEVLRDPGALLGAATGGAPPVVANHSFRDALAAYASLQGAGAVPPVPQLPPALDAPLANVVTALVRRDAGLDASAAVLATVAAELPALVRAGYNLSVATPGQLDALAGKARPVESMRATGLDQPLQVLADMAGPPREPERVALSEGLARLRSALGMQPPGEEALALERALGPAASQALGTLLAAQASYQEALSPEAGLGLRAAQLHEAARPIAARGGSLTTDEIALLQRSAQAQLAHRLAVAAEAGALLLAAQELLVLELSTSQSGLDPDVIYDDGVLVVTGPGDTLLTTERFAVAPVLLVDLGGNDTYWMPLAGVSANHTIVGTRVGPESTRTSIALDLGGSDRYEAVAPFTLGAAWGAAEAPAFALLLDAAGNDVYAGDEDVLGWGVDGIGLVIDAGGDDAYRATTSGIAGARTTNQTGFALGLLLEAGGDDTYRSGRGYGNLSGGRASLTTAAVFLELAGADHYLGDCVANVPCFGTPRPGQGQGERGLAVFVDHNGRNTFPPGQSVQSFTGSGSTPGVDGLLQRADGSMPEGAERLVIVRNGPVDPTLQDSDGDGLTDNVENLFLVGSDPNNRSSPHLTLGDADGDGYPDQLERVFGTNPQDKRDHPVGLPPPPPPVPPPSDVAPEVADLLPDTSSGDGFLLNLPNLGIAIGMPGTTRYVREYGNLTLDLGLSDADRYLNRTAHNGIAVDLGGDDWYTPPARVNEPHGLASATLVGMASTRNPVAALVDLGGSDRYVSGPGSQAFASSIGAVPALAVLLDAGGDDVYEADANAQGYAIGNAHALFFDLGGDDRYTFSTQGVVAAATGTATSLFVDAAGQDTYVRARGLTPPEDYDRYQGVTLSSATGVLAYASPQSAAFFDLAGRDVHRVRDRDTGNFVDISTLKNNRLHVRPLDGRGGAVNVYYDAGGPSENADGDFGPDAAEVLAGTDPARANETMFDPDLAARHGFVLDLPRLGLAVGSTVSTLHVHDYALAVDLGGVDTYRNRAGSSTPRFPAALAVDLGGDADVYRFTAQANLSSYHVLGAGGVPPGDTALDPYEDAVYGGAQGAGVLGIGVLHDGGGFNEFTLAASFTAHCSACLATARVVGAGQGAGILGAGVLTVATGGGAFRADVAAVGPALTGAKPLTYARTHAQGAGVFGIGILAAEGAASGDIYELAASAAGALDANAATTGQGYALRGIGVLLDGGGDNRFTAGRFAQAYADNSLLGAPRSDVGVTSTLFPDLRQSRGSLAALLLVGTGDDKLAATHQAQASAVAGGVALLVDLEGNDERRLQPPPGRTARGQAAAEPASLAILLDNRGNDVYAAAGREAQAYARDGTAILVDLSGSDHYEATGDAQACLVVVDHLHFQQGIVQARSNHPGAAVLLDRMGNDAYVLRAAEACGQGDVRAPDRLLVKATEAYAAAPGASLFVDAGGADFYDGYQPRRRAYTTLTPDSDRDGNDWVWTFSLPECHQGQRCHQALGVDRNDVAATFALLAGAVRPAAGARIEIVDLAGNPAPAVLEGTYRLRAWVGADAASVSAGIDRVEFYLDGKLIDQGVPTANAYELVWVTNATDADGHPRFPDGSRAVEVMIHPRAGTPDAAGRRAAVDSEPLRATKAVVLDNRPLLRTPDVAENLSMALGPLVLPLRVDRDLERGQCPACGDLPHAQPGPDEWDLVASPDPHGTAQADTTCATLDCKPSPQITSGNGKVYFRWSPPTRAADEIVGYRVFRNEGAGYVPLGFVRPDAPRQFIDHAPTASPVAYRLDALRVSASGLLLNASFFQSVALQNAPGPASGLAAYGTEGGVRLAWRAAPGATDYDVLRATGEGLLGWQASTADTTWLDTNVQPDVAYRYVVVPRNAAGTGVSSEEARAKASPGHRVTVTLDGAGASAVVLGEAPLGGDQTHAIRFDAKAAGLADGTYFLTTRIQDGAGRWANQTREVQLDGSPPQTTVLLPGHVGGQFVTPQGLRIPFAVDDSGSGAVATMAFVREQPHGWRAFGPFDPAQGYALVPAPLDGVRLDVVLLSLDAAGNHEGLAKARPWPTTFDDAFRDAVATRTSSHIVDISAPSGEAGDLRAVVRPGVQVPFRIVPVETGSGIHRAEVVVGAYRIPMTAVGGGAFRATWTAQGQGEMQAIAEILDRAGNRGRIPLGTVTVDADAPVVPSATVSFPGDRAIGRAGEFATLRAVVVDNGTSPLKLNVTADVSNVSSRETIVLTWAGEEHVFLGKDFLVDRLQGRHTVNVTLRAEDPAGNVARLEIPVQVDGTRVAMSAPVLAHLGADGVTVRWTTQTASRGKVLYGEGAQLGRTAGPGPHGLAHAIRLEGLAPDTEYFAKAVAISDAGVETVSELFTFRTSPALNVTIHPKEGAPHSNGAATVEIRISRYDGAPAGGVVDVLLEGPRGSPRVVASTTVVGGLAVVPLDLAAIRDGAYHLRATAQDGAARGASARMPLQVDRVAPMIDLDRTNVVVAGARVNVTVQERGSGVDLPNVSWYFGEEPCAATFDGDTLSCELPPMDADGDVRIRLRVPDKAGNVGLIETSLRVDGAPPQVGKVVLRGDGLPRLRPGAPALLEVEVADLSVREVRADLSGFGLAAEAPLALQRPGAFRAAFDVPAGAREGPVAVTITARDEGDRATTTLVRAVVDATPPEILEAAVNAQSSTEVVVAIRTNEPTRVHLRAVGQGLEEAKDQEAFKTHHLFRLTGVRPGSAVQAMVRVVDEAGHESAVVARGSALPDTQAPGAVSGLAATDLGDGRVRLSWIPARDDLGVEGYRVVRTIRGSPPETLPLAATTTLADVVPVGTPVLYTVTAVDHGGNDGPAEAVEVSSRAIPRLSNGTVDPPHGGPGLYVYQVEVRDASGRAPELVVKVDGVAHRMQPDRADCRDACVYRAVVAVGPETLASGPHRYSFHAASDAFSASFPDESAFVGPVVLGNDALREPGVVAAASRLPGPGFVAVLALVVLGAVVVAGMRRLRK